MTIKRPSDVLSVDGPRPAVAALAALPRSYKLTDAERLVLFALACDSFDGETSRPGYDALCEWTGLHKGRVVKALSDLCEAHKHRPALLVRESTRGRKRTEFRLMLEPVAERDQSVSRTDLNHEPVEEPVEEPVGEPVDQPDRLPSLSRSSLPPTPHVDTPGVSKVERREECDDKPPTSNDHRHDIDAGSELGNESRHALDPSDPRSDIDSRYWAWLNDRRDNAHRYEYNARLRIAKIHGRRRLPLTPEELLAEAYRLGDGNPWEGARIVDRHTEGSLATARDPARVVRSNLRNASPS